MSENGLEFILSNEALAQFLQMSSCKGVSLSGEKGTAENITLIDGILIKSSEDGERIISSAASENKLVFAEVEVEGVINSPGELVLNPVAQMLGGFTSMGALYAVACSRLHSGDVIVSQTKSDIRFKQDKMFIDVPRAKVQELRTVDLAERFKSKVNFADKTFSKLLDDGVTNVETPLQYKLVVTPTIQSFIVEQSKDVGFLKHDKYTLKFDYENQEISTSYKQQIKIGRKEDISLEYTGDGESVDTFVKVAKDGIENVFNNIPLRGDDTLTMWLDPESRVSILSGELTVPKAKIKYGITFLE